MLCCVDDWWWNRLFLSFVGCLAAVLIALSICGSGWVCVKRVFHTVHIIFAVVVVVLQDGDRNENMKTHFPISIIFRISVNYQETIRMKIRSNFTQNTIQRERVHKITWHKTRNETSKLRLQCLCCCCYCGLLFGEEKRFSNDSSELSVGENTLHVVVIISIHIKSTQSLERTYVWYFRN